MTATPTAAPPARERILEAACDLIAADGIDEVRIARVARRAGASTALVHHYFSTREELLEQALLHSFDRVAEERFGAEPEREETATEALARMVDECLPLPGRQQEEWVLWVELWLRAVRDEQLRPVAARLYRRYAAWLAATIRAGVEAGEFREVDAREVADHVVALLDGYGIRALIGDSRMDNDRARREIAAVLAAELGIEPGALAPTTP